MPSTIFVKNGANVVFVGDSLTALSYYNQGFVQQTNAAIRQYYTTYSASTSGVVARSTGASARSSGGTTPFAFLNVTNSGVPGNTTTDIATNVQSRITAFNPDIIVMLIGINDIHTGVPLGTIQSNVISIFSQIRAWSMTVPIIWISCMYSGETWTPGPPLAFTQVDVPSVDSVNSTIQTQCTADVNCVYVDGRTPALVQESILNTPAPGAISGILTVDGTHWNIAGQTLMSTILLQYVTVVQQ